MNESGKPLSRQRPKRLIAAGGKMLVRQATGVSADSRKRKMTSQTRYGRDFRQRSEHSKESRREVPRMISQKSLRPVAVSGSVGRALLRKERSRNDARQSLSRDTAEFGKSANGDKMSDSSRPSRNQALLRMFQQHVQS